MKQKTERSASLAERYLRADRDQVTKAARAGYTAKGVVYGMIGLIALQAAYYGGTSTEGSKDVLVRIARQPFGTFLSSMVLLGLLGYAIWRFHAAAWDVESKGKGAKGVVLRTGYAASGLVHLSLAVWGTRFLLGTVSAASGDSSEEEWTASLIQYSFGRWLVGFTGALVIAVGIYQFRIAATKAFMRGYGTSEMNPHASRAALWTGRAGLCARGVVFVLAGTFLVRAAATFDASQAKGLGETLDALARQPYGPWLLGTVAVGLLAYAVHCFTKARHGSFAAG